MAHQWNGISGYQHALNVSCPRDKLVWTSVALLSTYNLTRFGSLSKSGKLLAPVGLGLGLTGFFLASTLQSNIRSMGRKATEKEEAPAAEAPVAETEKKAE